MGPLYFILAFVKMNQELLRSIKEETRVRAHKSEWQRYNQSYIKRMRLRARTVYDTFLKLHYSKNAKSTIRNKGPSLWRVSTTELLYRWAGCINVFFKANIFRYGPSNTLKYCDKSFKDFWLIGVSGKAL